MSKELTIDNVGVLKVEVELDLVRDLELVNILIEASQSDDFKGWSFGTKLGFAIVSILNKELISDEKRRKGKARNILLKSKEL